MRLVPRPIVLNTTLQKVMNTQSVSFDPFYLRTCAIIFAESGNADSQLGVFSDALPFSRFDNGTAFPIQAVYTLQQHIITQIPATLLIMTTTTTTILLQARLLQNVSLDLILIYRTYAFEDLTCNSCRSWES